MTLTEYIENALQALTDGGDKPTSYPAVLTRAKEDVSWVLNQLYKEGKIIVHSNVNGIKIIAWKGGQGQ